MSCFCCPPATADVARLDWNPHPGFGGVTLTRNGEPVLDDSLAGDALTVQDFEERAAADPEADWRFEVHGPLAGAVFQRRGEGRWELIERTEGFA